MWKKVPIQHTRKLPPGVVSVRKKADRITIGADTVRKWQLKDYKTADMLQNDKDGVIGIQLRTDNMGDVIIRTRDNSMFLSCPSLLRELKTQPGHYLATRDNPGFIIVNLNNPVGKDWEEKREKHMRSYYD